MTAHEIDPLLPVWQRANEIDAKTKGVLTLAVALFELLLDKRVVTIDEVSAKLVSFAGQLEKPSGNDGSSMVVRMVLAALRDTNPDDRQKALRGLLH